MLKPFSYHELNARVRALLRRTRRRPATGRMRIGTLELDPLSRQVWLSGEPVALSKKEYALLRALAAEPTRVFTREELLRGVWGFRSLGHTRTLDSHAFRLRHKLSGSGERFVVNVWGVGYRLVDGSIEHDRSSSAAGWRQARRGRRPGHGGRCRRMESVARACHELRGPLTARG